MLGDACHVVVDRCGGLDGVEGSKEGLCLVGENNLETSYDLMTGRLPSPSTSFLPCGFHSDRPQLASPGVTGEGGTSKLLEAAMHIYFSDSLLWWFGLRYPHPHIGR